MRVLSVDLGTSNTVAVLSVPGMFPRLVEVDGASVMPSAVFAGEDGRLVVGREALRLARTRPERFEANPKRRIDDGELLLGDQVVPVVRAFTSVLGRVADEARRQLDDGGFDDVRLTHPASWGLVRRRVLAEAARSAGLAAQPVLIAEPVAAAAHFAAARRPLEPGEAIAVYDLGAGTFDVAVVGRTASGFEVLADDGLAEFGGVDIDQALLDYVGLRAASRDEQAWLRLLRPQSLSDRRARRALLDDVTAAKESLSHHEQTEVVLPDPFEDVLVTRGELEGLVRPALRRSVEVLAATIRAAGRTPQSLAGFYLVGGSSRIPLAAQLIAHQVGVVPTTLDQPETTVALGAHHATEAPALAPAPVVASLAAQPEATTGTLSPPPWQAVAQTAAPWPNPVAVQSPLSDPVPVQSPPPPPGPQPEAPQRKPRRVIARVTGTVALVGSIMLLLACFLNYLVIDEEYCYQGCDSSTDDYTLFGLIGPGTWALVGLALFAAVVAVCLWLRSAAGPGLLLGTAFAAAWLLLVVAHRTNARSWGYVDQTYVGYGDTPTSSYSFVGHLAPAFWLAFAGCLLLIAAGGGAALTIARDRDVRVRLRMRPDMLLISTGLVAIAGVVAFVLSDTKNVLAWFPAALLLVVPVLAVLTTPRPFGAGALLGWALGGGAIACGVYSTVHNLSSPPTVMVASFLVLAVLGAILLRGQPAKAIG